MGKRFRKEKLIVKKRVAINIRGGGWDGAKAADFLSPFACFGGLLLTAAASELLMCSYVINWTGGVEREEGEESDDNKNTSREG